MRAGGAEGRADSGNSRGLQGPTLWLTAMHGPQSAVPLLVLVPFAALRHVCSGEEIGVYLMPALYRLFGRWFPATASRAAREMAYLNASVSLYDLECREREISRGLFAAF